jgi:outer membrane protein OmpA-like peptidoglycan-associated protein
MRSKLHIIVIGLFITIAGAHSQISLNKVLKNVKKNAEKQIEQRIERKADKAVDKTLDKAEEGIDNSVKNIGKKKDEDKESKDKNISTENEQEKQETPTVEKASPVLTWNKYDFVPGTEIIFEDNQEGEQNGEFPSKWDLVEGEFENASFDGGNVIYHIRCNMNGGGGIVPLLKNAKEDYLPEEFTIEFDAYFNEQIAGNYHIYFLDFKNQKNLDKTVSYVKKYIRIYKNSVDGSGIGQNYYPGYKSGVYDKSTKWRHVAISFNKRALKVYLDDARVINIPNLGYNPTGISFGAQCGSDNHGYSKNFRIAKGAVPLYDKFLTNGKFVTTGIKFDVAKATIKPESMGIINYVVKMMTDHPELNFSVEGHTDSDGESASNQKLSEARAKAVTETMINAGISADRLSSKGYGETKPMTSNDTPEGKAQNRRVEFVKF